MVNITQEEFRQFSDYIKDNYGIFLKSEKKSLLVGRLNGILDEKGFKSFSEYFAHVVSDRTGAAAGLLVDKISTNYSFFMREPEHFEYLREKILPCFADVISDYDLRVWSAGCATGEEAYTLAFILDEFFSSNRLWDKKILATDISERALRVAKNGVYDKKQTEPLPGFWKLNYFDRLDDGRFRVKDRLRQEVLFSNFNLITDRFCFKKPFHIIFLRNVMIYFDNETRLNLLKRMYDATAPGGYLFLGHSEAIGSNETKYKYVMPAVYRKI